VALPPVALEKPLTVQGETVGHLALAEPQALTDDATEIINAVAESLSAHLENLRLTEQTEQALSQSEALYQGSAGLNTAQSYGEILEVMRKHSILGQGAGASIAAFNVPWAKKAPEWINILGRYEQKPSNNLPDRYRLKDLPSANKILKRDAPTIIQNVAKDFASVASAIFVPLVAGRQWIGYVLGTYDQPTEFPESELRRLMSLAGQAASTIQSIRLFRQTQEQLADLTTIQSTTAGLTATITMDEAINTLLPHIADAVQADNIAFFNIEEEYMIPVSVYPPQPDGFSQQPQRLADYPLTEEVIKTRQALALAADDPRLQPQAQEAFKATGVTATATIPLVTRKKVFAILTITMRQPGRLFTEQEVGLLQTLADQASIAIERVRLLEETARKAQREQMLREIAAKVRSSADVETIMRTAVQEIGQALGRQTFVYLDKGNSTDQT
jgi:GAF domain-containing protein